MQFLGSLIVSHSTPSRGTGRQRSFFVAWLRHCDGFLGGRKEEGRERRSSRGQVRQEEGSLYRSISSLQVFFFFFSLIFFQSNDTVESEDTNDDNNRDKKEKGIREMLLLLHRQRECKKRRNEKKSGRKKKRKFCGRRTEWTLRLVNLRSRAILPIICPNEHSVVMEWGVVVMLMQTW